MNCHNFKLGIGNAIGVTRPRHRRAGFHRQLNYGHLNQNFLGTLAFVTSKFQLRLWVVYVLKNVHFILLISKKLAINVINMKHWSQKLI